MDWLDTEIAEQWLKEGKRYASDVNAFVHKVFQGEHPDESELADDARHSIALRIMA